MQQRHRVLLSASSVGPSKAWRSAFCVPLHLISTAVLKSPACSQQLGSSLAAALASRHKHSNWHTEDELNQRCTKGSRLCHSPARC